MNGQTRYDDIEVVTKIAAMVEERGWNQEEFARLSDLNRHTVRQILLKRPGRRLRNSTISQCARALGLTVNDLRTQPLDLLLTRGKATPTQDVDENLRRLYERAMQPELHAWIERNSERAARLSPDEVEELFSLQGTGGPLTTVGVEHFVELIERKRKLFRQVQAIAGTEYLDVLEKLVQLMYEKIQVQASRR